MPRRDRRFGRGALRRGLRVESIALVEGVSSAHRIAPADMLSFEPADRPKWMTHDAVVAIESKRVRFLKNLYVSSIWFGLLYDNEVADTLDLVKVVVRDRGTERAVYSEGPYCLADAKRVAGDVHRSIRLFGLQGFLCDPRPPSG
jgi:hypothetical protein